LLNVGVTLLPEDFELLLGFENRFIGRVGSYHLAALRVGCSAIGVATQAGLFDFHLLPFSGQGAGGQVGDIV